MGFSVREAGEARAMPKPKIINLKTHLKGALEFLMFRPFGELRK